MRSYDKDKRYDNEESEERRKRFRILVCLDGEEEGYRGLRYAARMGGAHKDCDIVLLYVRPIDQGLATGGLQVRLARENILNWGLELPGIRYLKEGLSMLSIIPRLSLEITNNAPVFPAETIASALLFFKLSTASHKLVSLPFFAAVKALSSPSTTLSVWIISIRSFDTS